MENPPYLYTTKMRERGYDLCLISIRVIKVFSDSIYEGCCKKGEVAIPLTPTPSVPVRLLLYRNYI